MSELKLVSPLLDHMQIQRCISDTGAVQVYLLKNTITERTYVVKHISIPASQTQVEALIFSGAAADEAAAQAYYEQVVEDYKQQLQTLNELSGNPSVVTYLSCQIEKKEDQTGFDLYLLADYYESLATYLSENAMTHLRVLNLGIDLCTALNDLRAHGLIHRDIKPENVFLNGLNSFMLGDLGIAKLEDLKYSSIPDTMISEYSAPEISDIMAPLNETIDIYSVGMILYRILNGNHGPFEDEKTSSKAASKRRQSGEALPAPLYADYELAEIVLKACAPNPQERYQTPEQLMQDLILYMKRNNVSDTLLVPPIVTSDDETLPAEELDHQPEPVAFTDVAQLDAQFIHNFAPDTQGASAILEKPNAVHNESLEQPDTSSARDSEPSVPSEMEEESDPKTVLPDEPKASATPQPASSVPATPSRKNKWIPGLISAILIVAILVAAYFVFFYHGKVAVESVDVLEVGTNTITVSLTAEQSEHSLNLVCTDAYGNQQSLPFSGEAVTFDDLVPGTQYKITVTTEDGAAVSGNAYAMVATTAAAEVVSFTATSSSIGKVDLNLVISGTTPDQWTVKYQAVNGEEKVVTFSGNSTSIENLDTGTSYRFTLEAPEGIQLTGQTSVEFTTGSEVAIENLQVAELTATSVGVKWSCNSETPPSTWTVTCSGSDGSSESITTEEMQAQFTELKTGTTYTISVTSPATLSPAVISATPAELTILSVTAEAKDAGTVELSWESATPGSVMVVYSVEEAPDLSNMLHVSAEETSVTISQLIPGVTYHFQLMGEGGPLSGETDVSVTMPEAEKFSAYGCTSVFMGLFLRPESENWTYLDLAVSRTEFSADESIAFAVQALTNLQSSTDEILITYVVTDENGVPVDYYSGEGQWNSLWNNMLYVGELLRTPETAGTYQLTVYFNNQRLAVREFTVT